MNEFINSLNTPYFYWSLAAVVLVCFGIMGYLVTHPPKPRNKNSPPPPGQPADAPFNAALQDTLEDDKKTIPAANEKVSKGGEFNAVVLDDDTRSIGERRVELLPGKDYGRPRQYFTKQVFYLHRFRDGRIEPVPASPYKNMEHSPGETYMAVKTFEYIKVVFGSRSQKDHTKLWMVLVAIGAVLFIGFMVVNSGGH